MEKQIQALQEILDRGKRIVFFTGAGASLSLIHILRDAGN